MGDDHEWDDEDSFRSDMISTAIEADMVNYRIDAITDNHSWVIVQLFTGDRFKVSIEKVED